MIKKNAERVKPERSFDNLTFFDEKIITERLNYLTLGAPQT